MWKVAFYRILEERQPTTARMIYHADDTILITKSFDFVDIEKIARDRPVAEHDAVSETAAGLEVALRRTPRAADGEDGIGGGNDVEPGGTVVLAQTAVCDSGEKIRGVREASVVGRDDEEPKTWIGRSPRHRRRLPSRRFGDTGPSEFTARTLTTADLIHMKLSASATWNICNIHMQPITPLPEIGKTPPITLSFAARLLKIQLHTFNGDYLQWERFRNLYNTVHNVPGFSDATNLQHLKSILMEEAAKVIGNIPVTEPTTRELGNRWSDVFRKSVFMRLISVMRSRYRQWQMESADIVSP
ncbi:UNVERIFIED_CONTAM: hypothetical protein PYX00_006906 [Menopon gallinae]|uniref:Uncharacterized protein n=1 Tax=Menopon gallinae TaxID=328185 RepID=A0AAW2HX69_9NEOP